MGSPRRETSRAIKVRIQKAQEGQRNKLPTGGGKTGVLPILQPGPYSSAPPATAASRHAGGAPFCHRGPAQPSRAERNRALHAYTRDSLSTPIARPWGRGAMRQWGRGSWPAGRTGALRVVMSSVHECTRVYSTLVPRCLAWPGAVRTLDTLPQDAINIYGAKIEFYDRNFCEICIRAAKAIGWRVILRIGFVAFSSQKISQSLQMTIA